MIKESRIKENLKKFAFPRLSGTEFELKAFNMLKKEVEDLDLDYEIQKFTFSSFYSRIYPKIAFLSVTLILFLLYLNIFIIISLIFDLILLSIVITSILLTRNPEKIPIFFRFSSQNLLVKIKTITKNIENKDSIALFLSHIDSKGQRFKIKTRIRIIKLWISSSFFSIIVIILKNYMFREFEVILYIIGMLPLILNILATLLMALNTTNNSSDGAIDNASGITCNLELVNYYANPENRLENLNLWFLFTGAEECGTMGIRHFYNKLKNFVPEKSIIFDLESIDNRPFLFPGGNESDHAKNVVRLIIKNKRNFKIHPYITKRVFGTHSDGTFLGNRGFQGYGISGVQSHDYMHTPNDTIDKVDIDILKKLCLVLTDVLKEHDSHYYL
ncbi:MAG: M28 family metallopeptidase [Candidatus Odinarchaeota archaeon]